MPVHQIGLGVNDPVPDNVVRLDPPLCASDWPCPPHVLAMMHLVMKLSPEQASVAAGQLAAIYRLSGDAFTGMTVDMLELRK